MEEPMMTEAQRDELKTLCLKADVPDKSSELLTQEGAQHFIDDLKKQLAERSKRCQKALISLWKWGQWRSRTQRMTG